ncbi:MAG: TOBE domain-containing protein, partial [Burkholderiaceae bacterium]|nr:TOBE domain-containing protein [Burkholderiaceae bacterium]
LERKPTQLSGSQHQREAIGQAILREAKIVLFDEPLSNLDAELRVSMRAELRELHKRLRATMVYVTHDQVEAMTLADRIVVFNGGVVQQVGSPLELYDRPANLFVAGFLGAPKMNFLQGKLASGSAAITLPGDEHLPAAADVARGTAGRDVTLGIRPEHLRLAEESDAAALQAQVTLVEHLGDQMLAYLKVAGIAEDLCMKLPGHAVKLSYGDQVRVAFPPQQCLLFDHAGDAFPRIQ